MKVIPRRIQIEDIGAAGRSKGIHCSEIIKWILRRMDPERFKGGPIDPNQSIQGFIWEEILSTGFASLMRKQTLVQQLELSETLAGRTVYFTLDGLDHGKWKVHEYKATRMSAGRPILDHRFWHWFVQMKAYCRVAQSREAELWAFFVNGDYKNGPLMKRWEIEFSKGEIVEAWIMLENALKQMLKEGVVE